MLRAGRVGASAYLLCLVVQLALVRRVEVIEVGHEMAPDHIGKGAKVAEQAHLRRRELDVLAVIPPNEIAGSDAHFIRDSIKIAQPKILTPTNYVSRPRSRSLYTI